jgi:hypothetical protein
VWKATSGGGIHARKSLDLAEDQGKDEVATIFIIFSILSLNLMN